MSWRVWFSTFYMWNVFKKLFTISATRITWYAAMLHPHSIFKSNIILLLQQKCAAHVLGKDVLWWFSNSVYLKTRFQLLKTLDHIFIVDKLLNHWYCVIAENFPERTILFNCFVQLFIPSHNCIFFLIIWLPYLVIIFKWADAMCSSIFTKTADCSIAAQHGAKRRAIRYDGSDILHHNVIDITDQVDNGQSGFQTTLSRSSWLDMNAINNLKFDNDRLWSGEETQLMIITVLRG